MNGPKVEVAALVKPNHMREPPRTAVRYSFSDELGSQKPADMGTIRREGPICTSETLRDFTFGVAYETRCRLGGRLRGRRRLFPRCDQPACGHDHWISGTS